MEKFCFFAFWEIFLIFFCFCTPFCSSISAARVLPGARSIFLKYFLISSVRALISLSRRAHTIPFIIQHTTPLCLGAKEDDSSSQWNPQKRKNIRHPLRPSTMRIPCAFKVFTIFSHPRALKENIFRSLQQEKKIRNEKNLVLVE